MPRELKATVETGLGVVVRDQYRRRIAYFDSWPLYPSGPTDEEAQRNARRYLLSERMEKIVRAVAAGASLGVYFAGEARAIVTQLDKPIEEIDYAI